MPLKITLFGTLGLAVMVPVALYAFRGEWYDGIELDAVKLCCAGILMLMLADGAIRGMKKGE